MLLLATAVILFTSSISGEPSPCHLASGKTAACVPISECAHLTSLISNLQKPLPRDVALLIRESFFCGNTGGKVLVCCPEDGLATALAEPLVQEDRNTCGLQDNLPAECVVYNECSPFVQLMSNLRKPLPNSVPKLVRSSFLCGMENDSGKKFPKICCPSEALALLEVTTQPDSSTEPEDEHRYDDHPARSLLADDDSCGISLAERIVGGQDAKLGEFPWLVNLGFKQRGRSAPTYKCGGTLIGPQYVLTAAHCVTELPRGFSLITIRVGEHDLAKEIDCTVDNTLCNSPQDIDIEEVVYHESYGKPKAFQNDIALVKLAQKVEVTDFISPVCLPFSDDTKDYVTRMPGEEVETRVAGWGATTPTGRRPASILQFLDVNVTDSDDCKKIYASRGGVLTNRQMCAGGEKGKDSCVGDSGSGLMRLNKNDPMGQIKLIGVVSFGPRLCGTEGVPGVYTRVNSYMDWILDTVNRIN